MKTRPKPSRDEELAKSKELAIAAMNFVNTFKDEKATAEQIHDKAGILTQQAKFFSLTDPDLNAFMLKDLLKEETLTR